jgi:hypothetical protein
MPKSLIKYGGSLISIKIPLTVAQIIDAGLIVLGKANLAVSVYIPNM